MNNKQMKFLLCVVAVSVVLNIVLPMLAAQVASPEQAHPSVSPAELSLVDQVVHMFVHHSQVPVTSSIIVAAIVAISVCLGKAVCK